TLTGGAVEQLGGRNGRRELSELRQFSKDVQIRRARQAVGADRDRHTGSIELSDRRHTSAGAYVAARARDQRGAMGDQPLQIRCLHLPPMDGEYLSAQKSAFVEILHWRPAVRLPFGIPRADFVEERAPRPAAALDEFNFVR